IIRPAAQRREDRAFLRPRLGPRFAASRVMSRTARAPAGVREEPFDIDEVFRRLRRALKALPKAAMFDLRARGFDTPFEEPAGGFGRRAIAVDIHVHRGTSRWGYVATSSPEKTAAALAEVSPRRYWIEINERLVPFGKAICTGTRPRCSTCVLLSMCRQVGVV